MHNKIELTGKNVLITGASQGIGAGIAEAMAVCGANVLINYIADEKRVLAFADRLSDQYKVSCKAYPADISMPEQVDRMFDYIDKQMGGIDVLVNNAGIETINDALEMPLQEWDRIMNVNLRGAFYCAQQAGRRMRDKKRGVILNIASIHDRVARKGLIHYCTSKAGLNMLTKCLALELAEFNIRVIAVSPGAIETDMMASYSKEEVKELAEEIPLGRIGYPKEVADAVSYLISSRASYITGQILSVNGGWYI